MEWLLVAAAFMVFIVVPIGMIADMIFNPTQFGPAVPRAYEMKGYKPDIFDSICARIIKK